MAAARAARARVCLFRQMKMHSYVYGTTMHGPYYVLKYRYYRYYNSSNILGIPLVAVICKIRQMKMHRRAKWYRTRSS